jgi:ribosomal protein S18 acetylase RimI-like enzyme
MLQAAYATNRRLMDDTLRRDEAVVTDVYACDQTRQTLLAQLGFAEYRRWDFVLERSLVGELPVVLLPAGFSVRPATRHDAEQLALIHNSAFSDDWTAEEYRDEVMAKPGYQPERELVVVAPDGQFAAFTMIALDELNRVGLFEPVGTHAHFRRLGLARALMSHALGEMQRQGMARATLAHDATNQPAHALYRSLGFATKHETLGYRRM